MMSQTQGQSIWVVVKVWRGFPVLVEVYRDEQLAYTREQALRADINPDSDETGVFETCIRDSIELTTTCSP